MKQALKNTTAILVFANSSQVEERRKGVPNSKSLFDFLTEDIIKKAQKTKIPFFVYDETQQSGPDFATRFTTAVQSIFSKGFDGIITVGNDTPNLKVADLLQANENLLNGKTVIGPSFDGGIYLLGLHRESFDPIAFQQLPWQKRNLFHEAKNYFIKSGKLYQLPRLRDIDSTCDIPAIVNSTCPISLRVLSLLVKIMSFGHEIVPKHLAEKYTFSIPSYRFNKGSPQPNLQYPLIS